MSEPTIYRLHLTTIPILGPPQTHQEGRTAAK